MPPFESAILCVREIQFNLDSLTRSIDQVTSKYTT